jgi:twinkle protein
LLVDKITRQEIKVDETIFDEGIRPRDVIYGIDVKENAMTLYDSGFALVKGIDVPDIDARFKPKKGELTLLTGIGNYGKSSFKRWYQVFRVVLYGEKFATFSPEDNPPEEYYHDLVEILLGCDCTPRNPNRPNRDIYERAYDFVCRHFFYVYPKTADPTPTYIKEVFLELIIKENVDGCDIDPFNQMSNNYQGFAGRDKYLEWVLTDFSRFAVMNNVYFWIVAHPIKLPKQQDGNYPCPDVFDVADGAMWNNKMDNILVYHRPLAQTDPQNPMCEFHSKKIRRQVV